MRRGQGDRWRSASEQCGECWPGCAPGRRGRRGQGAGLLCWVGQSETVSELGLGVTRTPVYGRQGRRDQEEKFGTLQIKSFFFP